MTRGQRVVLAVLAVAVVLAGTAAMLIDDDDSVEVSADAATTSSTVATSTTSSSTTSTTATTSTTIAAMASGSGGIEVPSTTTTTEAPSIRSEPEPPAPPFEASIGPVTEAELGASWRTGCPVSPDQLRALNVSHWGYDGAVHAGRVIVHADQAQRVVDALHDVYDARFPIERMVPVSEYGGDDQESMKANNTSAFNCRYVAGSDPPTWSEHSYGRAIDINPLYNPYVKGSSVDPPEGAPYADRERNDPGMIHDDDAVVRAFARQGWKWGGYWQSGQDYQHFSASGR